MSGRWTATVFDGSGWRPSASGKRQRWVDLTVQGAAIEGEIAADLADTDFHGYGALEIPASVMALVGNGAPGQRAVCRRRVQLVLGCPRRFYGEFRYFFQVADR